MATERKLVFLIGQDGEVNLEAQGYSDGSCLKATEEIEKALGMVTHREKKPEALRAPAKEQLTVGKK